MMGPWNLPSAFLDLCYKENKVFLTAKAAKEIKDFYHKCTETSKLIESQIYFLQALLKTDKITQQCPEANDTAICLLMQEK